jgi:2-polyprenyl-3-methyl-5-hydroxy-6-metoxy-1,4-benzoquinol methylase
MTSWRSRDAAITEWLDAETLDRTALDLNLRDIRRINVLLGWTGFTARSIVAAMRQEPDRAWTLLDVASGSADIPIAIARAAARAGIALEITVTDRSPQICAIAREQSRNVGGVRVEVQDALALPYAARSYDVALCTLALHHFEPVAARALLASLARVGRRVFIYDLVRSPVAYAGFVTLASLARMHPMTRHDGAASVRRAYSLKEARALAESAGLRNIQASVRFPYRLALIADGAAAAGGPDAL